MSVKPHLTVGRLRLHNAGPEAFALRLGLEQALRRVNPRATRLPPQAIVVIRRLRSETPFAPQPAARLGWQRQLEAEVGNLARQAARPAQQRVPAGAESVLFMDAVELLLCYTRDVLAQRTAWYWDALFPDAAYVGQPAGQRLLNGWSAYPQAIPRTLVDLQPDEAQQALAALQPTALAGLVHLLHETFALPPDVLQATYHTERKTPRQAQNAVTANAPSGEARTAAPPWRAWLPAAGYRLLSPQAAYVLGLSYALVRSPQQARLPRFAQEARRWLQQESGARQTEGQSDTGVRSTSNRREGQLAAETAPTTGPLTLEPEAEPVLVAPHGAGVHTRLGAAFFLINLLAELKLPASLSALETLNPWHLFGALAAMLLGDEFDAHGDDPLWRLVDELAAAENERWGSGLPAPQDISLLPQWFARLGSNQLFCHRERRDGRVRLWAEAILIADLVERPAALEGLVAAYREAGIDLRWEAREGWAALPAAAAGLEKRVAPSLAWYLRRLQPFVEHLLAHLTGTTLTAAMWQQPGLVHASRTHLDLSFALQQISLPLRRAGLDRSPGWLPDFGYIVTIHFE